MEFVTSEIKMISLGRRLTIFRRVEIVVNQAYLLYSTPREVERVTQVKLSCKEGLTYHSVSSQTSAELAYRSVESQSF